MSLQIIHINKQLELCSYDFRPSFKRKGCYVYKIKQWFKIIIIRNNIVQASN